MLRKAKSRAEQQTMPLKAPELPEQTTVGASDADRRMVTWAVDGLCTGCGLCVEIAPTVFTLVDKEARVMQNETPLEAGEGGRALVAKGQEANVLAAENQCPGDTIMVEYIGGTVIGSERTAANIPQTGPAETL